ncbi:unannotated protein [freshwater metagenome]|uniref:Unannotated protein n=1 Tax=freshwater metagenome TaxID=449393 RepID=A0A6J6GCZ3_9ZZZZ
MFSIGIISKPETNLASAALAIGTITRSISEPNNDINAGRTPRASLIRPSRASSPKKTDPTTLSIGITSCAAKIATAIGKSKFEPLLGSHAGESETVTFLFGHSSRELTKAERTRSRDSINAKSGNPSNE